MLRRLAIAAALLLAAIVGVSADIVTCGGFVKASTSLAQAFTDVKLDYSIVKMHLYTSDGLLKYSTECAPNGYYFIPVYDKGSFYLQIEGPQGWAFEPARVPFAVGDDDAHNGCSEDINFHFTGFSLSGKVLASASPSCYSVGSGSGSAGGPAGVTIALMSTSASGESVRVQQTQTVAGGSFSFANVFPGAYSVAATHPVWTLTPATHQVTVAWGNAELKQVFQLNGYDVRGKVTSSGAAVAGVDVFLYGSAGANIDCPKPTATAPANPAGVADGEELLCATQSAADTGAFRFANIPCGIYRLVPHYHRSTTTYDVVPSNRVVNVTHAGTVDLTSDDNAFQVMGFSVGGRVVDRAGNGVEGVAIALDGTAKTTTDKDGSYKLEQIQTGRYSIRATKSHVFFHELKAVSVTPNMGALPDITVTSYHICGVVNSGEPVRARSIALAGPQGMATTTTADADGNYCFAVAPGTYTITPAVTSSEQAKSILLSPPSRNVVLTDAPVLSAHFVQARVRVSGRVKCMGGACTGVTAKVHLISKNDADQKMIAAVNHAAGDVFHFVDVLPGTYTVSISGSGASSGWCWKRQSFELNVEYTDVEGVEFEQSGYLLQTSTSHDGVTLKVTGPSGYDEAHKQVKGANRICLPRAGVYTARPESCYRFAAESFSFDTSAASQQPIDLNVKEYRVTGTVEAGASSAAARSKTLPVKVQADGASETEVTATYDRTEARDHKGDVRVYTYSFWAAADKQYTVSTPVFPTTNTQQTDVLFYPRIRTVTVPKRTAGCATTVDVFEGRAGVYMSGSVSPATADVTITVTSLKDGAESFVKTDSYGAYRAGPLYDDQQYKVAASADGYHFKEESKGQFRAVKLGQIAITITDQAGVGLPGVLLSLSGGDGYRRNNATDANGKFEFTQLFPGDYFLRPLLKEYEFDPSTRPLKVTDAAKVEGTFAANRIAYSVFGVVRSLNGEAEKNVVVEALQDQVPEGAPRRQEETKTDQSGAYRLRGLMPGLSYRVSVKLANASAPASSAADAAVRIERAAPAFSSVKVARADMMGHDFVAFRRTGKYDLTGVVNASATIIATQLQQLEVVVATEANPSVAVKTHGLSRGFPFFEFNALPEDKYVVFVRPLAAYTASSSLPPAALAAAVITPRTHAITAPYETVVLNAHTHVRPAFDAEYHAVSESRDSAPTTVGNPSDPASSLLTLVLALAVAFAAFNRKKVSQFVDQAKGVARSVGLVPGAPAAVETGSDDIAGKRRKPKGNKK